MRAFLAFMNAIAAAFFAYWAIVDARSLSVVDLLFILGLATLLLSNTIYILSVDVGEKSLVARIGRGVRAFGKAFRN